MTIAHFISDTHFGHDNIIAFSNHPFANAAEMNAALIARYNDRVKDHETVLWVGDCFFCGLKDAAKILRQLNGHKILVRGNHDGTASAMARIGFDVVVDSLTMHIAGVTARVHHYPYRSEAYGDDNERVARAELKWPERRKGEVLLHGHIHSPKRRKGRAIHVGVDAWDYRPASLDEIAALVAQAMA